MEKGCYGCVPNEATPIIVGGGIIGFIGLKFFGILCSCVHVATLWPWQNSSEVLMVSWLRGVN